MKLKPCPFCGRPAKLNSGKVGSITKYIVFCPADDGICVEPQTGWEYKKQVAIDRWNTRG